MQLCGWVTAEMPWTGAVEDGDYHSNAGYMEAQKVFQEADLVDGKVVSSTTYWTEGTEVMWLHFERTNYLYNLRQQEAIGVSEARKRYTQVLLLVTDLEMNEG
ncbi:hypothetical protein ACHAWC_001658 [Mediolabrus comicus]